MRFSLLKLQTGGVEVLTIQGRYIPPLLIEAELKNKFDSIMNEEISDSEKKFRIFLFLSKNQVLANGNRRDSFLIANKMIFSEFIGILSLKKTVKK